MRGFENTKESNLRKASASPYFLYLRRVRINKSTVRLIKLCKRSPNKSTTNCPEYLYQVRIENENGRTSATLRSRILFPSRGYIHKIGALLGVAPIISILKNLMKKTCSLIKSFLKVETTVQVIEILHIFVIMQKSR